MDTVMAGAPLPAHAPKPPREGLARLGIFSKGQASSCALCPQKAAQGPETPPAVYPLPRDQTQVSCTLPSEPPGKPASMQTISLKAERSVVTSSLVSGIMLPGLKPVFL